jgi:hypothetical protein
MDHALVEVVAAEPLDGFWVRLTFSDGVTREFDFWPLIGTGEIFAPVRGDVAYFRRLSIQDGSVAWPNGSDLDPVVLRYHPDVQPATSEP